MGVEVLWRLMGSPRTTHFTRLEVVGSNRRRAYEHPRSVFPSLPLSPLPERPGRGTPACLWGSGRIYREMAQGRARGGSVGNQSLGRT